MIGSVATVGGGTLLSRVFGFIRDTMVAAILGAGPLADAFFAAFQLLNVARRFFSEGALNAALVPAYLKARSEGEESAARFAGRILATVTLALLLLALLLGVAMPHVISLIAPGFKGDARLAIAVNNARYMLPFLAVGGPVIVLTGLLNAQERFTVAALVPTLFNIALIIVIFGLLITHADTSQAGFALSATIGIVGFVQAAVLIWHTARVGIEAKPLKATMDADMRLFARRAIPGMIAAVLPQVVLVIAVMLASHLPSAVSWLYFANRLFELPIGIVGAALGTVLIPAVTRAVHDNDHNALATAERHAFELASGLSFPAAIGLFLLSEPIVHTLFEHGAFRSGDTTETALALSMLAAGLPGYVFAKSLAPVFFARDNTMIPMQATLVGLAVMAVAGWFFERMAGAPGIAAAIALAGWATTAYLVIRRRRFFRDFPGQAITARLPRILLASAIMGLAIFVVPDAWLSGAALPALRSRATEAAALVGTIMMGLFVYSAALVILGVVPLSFFKNRPWRTPAP